MTQHKATEKIKITLAYLRDLIVYILDFFHSKLISITSKNLTR